MTIIIHFRDGFELPIKCETFEKTVNNITGKIIEYKITGIEDNKPLYLSLEDITCIYRKRED